MKKYVIAIGSEEIGTQVQEALFSAGFWWNGRGKVILHDPSAFIYLNQSDDSGCMTQFSSSESATRYVSNGHILITSQEVIADPFSLDGATRPVKEMTVGEIGKALGYEIKVVK